MPCEANPIIRCPSRTVKQGNRAFKKTMISYIVHVATASVRCMIVECSNIDRNCERAGSEDDHTNGINDDSIEAFRDSPSGLC